CARDIKPDDCVEVRIVFFDAGEEMLQRLGGEHLAFANEPGDLDCRFEVKLIHGLRPICSRPRIKTSGLVRVFVPAGGTPDIIARLIGQSLSQRLGQPVSSTTGRAARTRLLRHFGGAYSLPVCFVCAPSAPLCLCCRRVMRAQVRCRSSRTAMCNVPQPSQVSSMLSPSMNGLSPRWLVPVARMSPGCSV